MVEVEGEPTTLTMESVTTSTAFAWVVETSSTSMGRSQTVHGRHTKKIHVANQIVENRCNGVRNS